MSADNFIAIVKKGRNYTGYYCCASHNYFYVECFACLGKKLFGTTSLRHAIDLAQAEHTEYGYSVHDWADYDRAEESFNYLEVCPCEPRMLVDKVK